MTTLKRTFAAITDYENNGYEDNSNKHVLSKSRCYYTVEYTQLTTLENL